MEPNDEESHVQRIPNMKICVRRVRVEGLKRTKNDIVVEQIKGVLKATSLGEMLGLSMLSVEKLRSLNIFKNISLNLDTVKDDKGNTSGLEVCFVVQECGQIAASVSASAGTQSGDASLSLSLKNLFGRAEQLRAVSTTAFPNWCNTFQLEFTKPYYADIAKKFIATIGRTDLKQPACGFQEYITGPKLEYLFLSWLGVHSLSWAFDWRQVSGMCHDIPVQVRSQAGHSLKSSIAHVMETDERDDPLIPHRGFHTRAVQEVAGLGGDVVFGKAEVQTELYKEIAHDWVGCLSLRFGVMRALQGKINDRFLLGGPTTLRGFHIWGVGPRAQGYSLGGEMYWAGGLHLYRPLPYSSGEFFRRIRMHAFMNAGNLISVCRLSNLPKMVTKTRLSCGIGLSVRIGAAQIEMNYVFPFRAEPSDSLWPGLQFGVGLDML